MTPLVWKGEKRERLTSAFSEIYVWLRPGSDEPLLLQDDGEQWAIASSVPSPEAAGAPDRSRFRAVVSPVDLEFLPIGVGLKVDTWLPTAFAIGFPAVDQFRDVEASTGREPHFTVWRIPPHLLPMVDDAYTAAKKVGAASLCAGWVTSDTTSGLLVAVRPRFKWARAATQRALDAAFATIERYAPHDRACVVAAHTLPRRRRTMVAIQDGESHRPPDSKISGKQHAKVIAATLFGCVLLEQAEEHTGHVGIALNRLGWLVVVLILVYAFKLAAAHPQESPLFSMVRPSRGRRVNWFVIIFVAWWMFGALRNLWQ